MWTKKGDLVTELILEVFKLNGHLLAEGDRIAGQFGLTSARWKVLGAVSLAKESLSVAHIAREMGQARQSVQRIADEMVQDGYFTWKNNPAHKKAKLLHLTAKGKRTFEALEHAQAPWANEIAKEIDQKELKTSLKVLKELVDQFE